MNPSARSPLLGLLVVAALALGIERLIVTDTERIEDLAKEASRAIREQAWERLEVLMDEEFEYRGRNREATLAHVRSLVRKYRPTHVRITLFDVRITGDQARAQGVVEGTALGRVARVGVEAELRRTPEGAWRLLRVTGGEFVR